MEKILYDDKAAQIKTVTGWVSSHNRFYGDDEDLARWDGCTHKICNCGNEFEKRSTMCGDCWSKKSKERYDKKPFKKWDGVEPLTIQGQEIWFFHKHELLDYICDEGIDPKDLMLVICEPNYASELSDEIYCDELPEDTYIDDVFPELAEAIENVNKIIRENKTVLSWGEGEYRTKYEVNKV